METTSLTKTNMNDQELTHQFVDEIPADLTQGVVYVCIQYATVVHLCCCGCGNEVVTPLSPTDWRLSFDGVSVSLKPSIGNWSFDCQSHYWIRKNQVSWAPRWTPSQIGHGRAVDRATKERRYREFEPLQDRAAKPDARRSSDDTLWTKIKQWLGL
jgi:hypothetical protein